MTQPVITPKEFTSRMYMIAHTENPNKYIDPEKEHGNADDLMADILVSLGYSEGIDIYRDMMKWYA